MKDTRHLKDTVMPEKNGAQPYRILSSKKYVSMDETVGTICQWCRRMDIDSKRSATIYVSFI
jgi:hypothetical protein